jgi:hypothetical protein
VISGKNILQMVGRESFSLRYENGSSNADNLSELYDNFNKNDQKIYFKQATNE